MQAEVALLGFTELNAGLTLYNLKTSVVGKGTGLSEELKLHLNNTELEVSDAFFDRKSQAFAVKQRAR